MQDQYGVLGKSHDLLGHATDQCTTNAPVTATAHDDQVRCTRFSCCQYFRKGLADAHFALCQYARALRLQGGLGDEGLCLYAQVFGSDNRNHMQR